MESTESGSGKVTRRELLRLVAVSAVGGGAILGARILVGAAFPPPAPAATPTSHSTATAHGPSNQPAQQVQVKVVYFQMPLVVDNSVEYYDLETPAYYGDLLSQILQGHPNLEPMMPTMMIMIDGVLAPPQSKMTLQDGVEVDFIPAMAGG